jgi:trehalose/maltose hydrolase-like predicted phosphorylase
MNPWKLIYNDWKPEEQGLREALLTLGNGYIATRGAAEESTANDVNYPGTYLAGGYNRLLSEVGGRMIENEDLVNWPNWLYLKFRIKGGVWFDLSTVKLHAYNQELDTESGLLCRSLTFEDAQSNITTLTCKRFISMNDKHMAGIQWVLVPQNWTAEVEVLSGLDGNVINWGVKRYRKLKSQHLSLVNMSHTEEGVYLKVKASQSGIEMAQSARTSFYINDKSVEVQPELIAEKSFIAQQFTITCQQGAPLTIEKIVSVYTSRDWAISEAGLEARTAIARAGRYADLFQKHVRSWKQLWNRCDIEIAGDTYAQMILRLHIFHLLQTASFHTIHLDAGIPARGLHGEAYRGHIFWDELFIFPFLNLRLPELTRELIMYRYRRLREARYIAMEAGCKGACFAWQSGANGREETPQLHLNPKSGNWHPDNTYLQRHVNVAIVYNIWQYYQASNDKEFMTFYGARMILEIAWFFASLSTYNEAKALYELKSVVGPDEYHTGYPGENSLGLNNNAYTNVMASWVLQRAADVLKLISQSRRNELLNSLGIDKQELNRWEKISKNLFVPFHENTIISQFEGYENLKELDWDKYRKAHGDNMRLDRILEAEGDSVQNYKASKQADVLMLFFVFSYNELKLLFEHMGYELTREMIQDNIRYYEERTSHGSTLSQLVHTWVQARADRKASWAHFRKALEFDIKDVQGGTTQEGIHLGAMASTVDLVQRGYTGLEIRNDVLWFNPSLPDTLRHLKMRLCYRRHWLSITINHKHLEITFENGMHGPVQIGFKGEVYSSEHKRTLIFDL